MKTYKERLEAGLAAMGYDRCLGRSSRKYVAWSRDGAKFLFVGPSGALRLGRCVTESHSVGCPGMESEFYRRLLAARDRALEADEAPAVVMMSRGEALAALGLRESAKKLAPPFLFCGQGFKGFVRRRLCSSGKRIPLTRAAKEKGKQNEQRK